MIYFTSDWHLGHKNIIKHSKRPFSDMDEMHRELIRRYKAVVTDKDDVWFLGDIGFWRFERTEDLIGRLPGRKHLIYGNHDKADRAKLAGLFLSVQDYKELKVTNDDLFILMHYPLEFWNKGHYGSTHLHGHCHGSLPFDKGKRRLDVGVDVHNYTPISVARVLEITAKCETPYHH